MGISPAAEEYQRRQIEALEGLNGVEVIADDILVFGSGETMEAAQADHDKNLEAVLQRARKVNLKLNRSKLQLCKTSVPYMGHMLTADGILPHPDKVEAIQEMPAPNSPKSVQRMLGFVKYLSSFLPHLSDITKPLRALQNLTNDPHFCWQWGSQEQAIFDEVKRLVTSAPVLKYFDVGEDVTIECDASSTGMGAVLMQGGRPVSFASRTLTPTEEGYATIEKECLAIVFACTRFDSYIYGKQRVQVVTDHKPLIPIFQKYINKSPKRLQRMLLALQKYDIEVTHRKGTEMIISDMLSRAAVPGTSSEDTKFEVLAAELECVNPAEFLHISNTRLDELKLQTGSDDTLQLLMTTIRNGWSERRATPKILLPYFPNRHELSLHDGLVYKNGRVVVPKGMRSDILKRIHCSHLGVGSCLRKGRDVVYWPGMKHDIKDHVEKCDTCAQFQPTQTREPMLSYDIPETPWSTVALDLFQLKNKDYVVLVDYYSDYFEVQKMSKTTSTAVIDFCKACFARHGIPHILISDNGPQLVSQEFKAFATDWDFVHKTSSPYHSQANGKAEAAVKIAKNLIKKSKESGEDVYKALLDLRNTPTQDLGSSPVQRLMSRRTRGQVHISTDLLKPEVQKGVQAKIENKRAKAKAQYDQGTKNLPELQSHQPVWVQSQSAPRKWSRATCVGKVAPRSYLLESESGQLLRRNRISIRSDNTRDTSGTHPLVPSTSSLPRPVVPSSSSNEDSVCENRQSQSSDPGAVEAATASQTTPDVAVLPAQQDATPSVPHVRPQRNKVMPDKFKDFIMAKPVKPQ